MIKNTFYSYAFVSLLLLFTPVFCEDSPVFCVVGVKNNVKEKEWKNVEIGFGLSNMLTQYIYESKLFVPIEEKDEIKKSIQKHRELFWTQKGRIDKEKTKILFNKMAEIVFYGEVLKCNKKTQKLGIGPFGKYKTTIKVVFRLHMMDNINGKQLSSEGTGYSEKGASTLFFEVKDGKIDFNSTMTGIACKEAVEDAVANLLTRVSRKVPS